MAAAAAQPQPRRTPWRAIGRRRLRAAPSPSRAPASAPAQASERLPSAALRERVGVVLGAPACALYARALGLEAFYLQDGPTSVRPATRPAAHAAQPARAGGASGSAAWERAMREADASDEARLALTIEAIAGGLYACRSLHAVRRLLFATLLPAGGAPLLAPLGEVRSPETALPAADGELRQFHLARWLETPEGRRGADARAAGLSALVLPSDSDSDAGDGDAGAAEIAGGESAAAVVAAMVAAVSTPTPRARPPHSTTLSLSAARGLSSDVRAIRESVGQTGQTVVQVLEEVRRLQQSVRALDSGSQRAAADASPRRPS